MITHNGVLPERNIQTCIGPVQVKIPFAKDRQPDNESGPILFRSSLLPHTLRKPKALKN